MPHSHGGPRKRETPEEREALLRAVSARLAERVQAHLTSAEPSERATLLAVAAPPGVDKPHAGQTISTTSACGLLHPDIGRCGNMGQILEFYLNMLYFGDGAYGTGAASARYRKTSRKALVIHPRDELPCLIGAGRGGPPDRACRVLDNSQKVEYPSNKGSKFRKGNPPSDGQEAETQH